MKIIINSKPWLSEPALIPLPWNYGPISPSHPLKIAVMYHDGVVMPHPPITHALHSFVSKLKAISNISVVEWKPHLHDEAWAIVSSLYFTDGGAEDASAIAESGEPWRPLTTWMLKENPCVKKLTPQKLYYWQEEREAYRKEYANIWNETATRRVERGELEGMVDVILCPVGPGVAPKHNTAKYWGYTSQWNLLDYPAVVFPVGWVEKEKDRWEEGMIALTDIDGENQKLCGFSLRQRSKKLIYEQMMRKSLMGCLSHCNLWGGDLKMRKFSQFWNTSKRRWIFLSRNFFETRWYISQNQWVSKDKKTSSVMSNNIVLAVTPSYMR